VREQSGKQKVLGSPAAESNAALGGLATAVSARGRSSRRLYEVGRKPEHASNAHDAGADGERPERQIGLAGLQ